MLNLFKTEMLRHCSWIAIVAVAHFLALYYFFLLGSSITSGTLATGWLVGVMVSAATFGVLQMKLHKRNNDWVYLLHRPLPQGKIHTALTFAGGALLGLALLLPALLILAVMHIDGRLGTELRHYQMPLFGATLALTAYCIGQFIVLSSNRLAFLALVLLLPFMFKALSYSERLGTSLLLMVWSLAIAHFSFRPDPGRVQASVPKLVLTELPVLFGCYAVFVLMLVTNLMVTSGTESAFRNNTPDTFNRVTALSGKDQLLFALQQSTHADSDFLAQQATLAEVIPITPVVRTHAPERHEIPLNDNKAILDDAAANVYWLFSHDVMLYEGLDTGAGNHAGWLGPQGFTAPNTGLPAVCFPAVPVATTNEFLVVGDRLYQIDWAERAVHLRYTKAGHDTFTDSLFVSENFASIFSQSQLFIFSTQDLRDPATTLEPRAILNISSRVDGRPFAGFHVMELINGYLVLAVVDAPARGNLVEVVMEGKARLQVWRAVPGIEAELITSVPLAADLREFLQFADFVAAPGMRVLADTFWGFKVGKSTERTFAVAYIDFPAWVTVATLFACAFSAAMTAWLLRKSKLPAHIRRAWVVMCAVTGIAGLLAFLVRYYLRGAELLKLPLQIQAHKSVETNP